MNQKLMMDNSKEIKIENNIQISHLKIGGIYEYNLGHENPKWVKCVIKTPKKMIKVSSPELFATITEGDMKGTRWVINERTISRLREVPPFNL